MDRQTIEDINRLLYGTEPISQIEGNALPIVSNKKVQKLLSEPHSVFYEEMVIFTIKELRRKERAKTYEELIADNVANDITHSHRNPEVESFLRILSHFIEWSEDGAIAKDLRQHKAAIAKNLKRREI